MSGLRRDDIPAIGWAENPADEPGAIFAAYSTHVAAAALNAALSAQRSEAEMTTQLWAVVHTRGGHLRHLQHRLKAPSSLARKIETKRKATGSTAEQAAQRLDDTIRYTVTTRRPRDLIPTMTATVDDLTDCGWSVTSAEHSFVKGNPYKGVHLILTGPQGHRCEVQFHTDRALEAKTRSHRQYDTYRDLDASQQHRRAAFNRCVELWDPIPTPTGLHKLTHIGHTPFVVKDYRGKTS